MMPSSQIPPRAKVILAGAGPGDPELLTLKAKTTLENADVVVYDYLVNPEILKHIPEHAERIDAGKRRGHHSIPQENINTLLVQKALENKIVVRLKGGDPFVFGRGGEELERILKAGIPFDIIPGVSSINAVPASVGIPLTHRDYSSNLVVLTGVEHPEKPQTMIDWKAVSKVGTIVVMMGVSVLQKVTQNLMKEGLTPETPIVIIERGTWEQQRSIKGSLSNIVSLATEHHIVAPALIIIGKVCDSYLKDSPASLI